MEEEECRIAVCIRAADTGQLLLTLAPPATNPVLLSPLKCRTRAQMGLRTVFLCPATMCARGAGEAQTGPTCLCGPLGPSLFATAIDIRGGAVLLAALGGRSGRSCGVLALGQRPSSIMLLELLPAQVEGLVGVLLVFAEGGNLLLHLAKLEISSASASRSARSLSLPAAADLEERERKASSAVFWLTRATMSATSLVANDSPSPAARSQRERAPRRA